MEVVLPLWLSCCLLKVVFVSKELVYVPDVFCTGVYQRCSLYNACDTSKCLPMGFEWPDGVLGVHEATAHLLSSAANILEAVLSSLC